MEDGVKAARGVLATDSFIEAPVFDGTRVLLGVGGQATRVLLAGEYVRVELHGVPSSDVTEDVESDDEGDTPEPFVSGVVGHALTTGSGRKMQLAEWQWGPAMLRTLASFLNPAGIATPVRVTLGGAERGGTTSWGTLTFAKPEDAAAAVVVLDGHVVQSAGVDHHELRLQAEPALQQVPSGVDPGADDGPDQSMLQAFVTFPEPKSRGVGFVTFESAADVANLIASVAAGDDVTTARGERVRVKAMTPTTVEVQKLPTRINDQVCAVPHAGVEAGLSHVCARRAS